MHGTLYTTCVPSVHGDQKRALDLLESQFQTSIWVLGLKRRSFGRVANFLIG